jgi:amidohydrolase
MSQAAPNHSPRFYVDESALVQGVRALIALALEYLQQSTAVKQPLPGEV